MRTRIHFDKDVEGTSNPQCSTPYYTTLMETLYHVGALSSRDKGLLKFRYGLGHGIRQHTLAETGQEFGLSAERVRQLVMRSLKRLRTAHV